MAIPIQNHKLTPEQYLKLFSNPVSGIACDMNGAGTNYDYAHFGRFHLKNIRYSKSMMLGALKFWKKQILNYYFKVKSIYNPLNSLYIVRDLEGQLAELSTIIIKVTGYPDTFLFSHRHIEELNINKYRKPNGLSEQNLLLKTKYNMQFIHQEYTMQQFTRVKTEVGIEFTVFPCEHPYIPKQKITRVGMTEKGNVFILHGAEKKK